MPDNSKEFLSSIDKIQEESKNRERTLLLEQETHAQELKLGTKEAFSILPKMFDEFLTKSFELGLNPNAKIHRKSWLHDWIWPQDPRLEAIWGVLIKGIRANMILMRTNGQIYYRWKGGKYIDLGGDYGSYTEPAYRRLSTLQDFQHAFYSENPKNINQSIQLFRTNLDFALRGQLEEVSIDQNSYITQNEIKHSSQYS